MSTKDGYWQRNPGEVERARALWERGGLSASAIGRALGVTKNAICGLKNRQGWEQRESPIQSGAVRKDVSVRQKQRRIQAIRAERVSLSPLASIAIVLPVEVAKKKPEPPKKAPRPNARQCEYLFGDKPFVRCTNKAWPGYPYCRECAQRAYVNWKGIYPKEEAAL